MFLRASILLTAAATLTGAASDVHPRNFALIESALNSVNSLLQQIDLSILALNASNIATAGLQLVQLGKTVQPSLAGAIAQIQASQPLNLDETTGLNTARLALDQNVNLTVNDLLSKKPIIDMANLSGQAADELQQVRDSASMLFATVNTKTAPGAPDLAKSFSQVLNVFDGAITVFRGQTPASAANAAAAPAAPASSSVTGMGTISSDGSCNCAVACPAGSFMVMGV